MFNREERYYVLKIDDVEQHLNEEDQATLLGLIDKVASCRFEAGKESRTFVVCQDNWSCYEQVWDLIKQESETQS